MTEPKELKMMITGKILQKGNTLRIFKNHRTNGRYIGHIEEYTKTIKDMAVQVMALRGRKKFKGPVSVTMVIYYANKASDLDESMIMDALERGGAYEDDNQVFRKISEKRHDKENPRVEVVITPMPPKHGDTLLTELIGGEFRVVEGEDD